jgi:hypothetical protein
MEDEASDIEEEISDNEETSPR